MKNSELVRKKIKEYDPKGGLDHTALFFLALASVNHNSVKQHVERVALLSEAVALRMQKDTKATFFAGLLHDIGKILLPSELFEDRDITAEEYERIKTHAIASFEVLKDFHGFTAICAGLHHALYKAGYGLTIDDFPKYFSLAVIKKILEISAIISIVDFIDAYTHRKTKIKDGSDKGGKSLKEMLFAKYPDDKQVVEIALEENKW